MALHSINFWEALFPPFQHSLLLHFFENVALQALLISILNICDIQRKNYNNKTERQWKQSALPHLFIIEYPTEGGDKYQLYEQVELF